MTRLASPNFLEIWRSGLLAREKYNNTYLIIWQVFLPPKADPKAAPTDLYQIPAKERSETKKGEKSHDIGNRGEDNIGTLCRVTA